MFENPSLFFSLLSFAKFIYKMDIIRIISKNLIQKLALSYVSSTILFFVFIVIVKNRKKKFFEQSEKQQRQIKYFLDDLTLWFYRYLHFVIYIFQMIAFFRVSVCLLSVSTRVFIFILIAFHWKLNRHPMCTRWLCWAQNRNECVRLFSWHNLIEWVKRLENHARTHIHTHIQANNKSRTKRFLLSSSNNYFEYTGLFPFGMFITIVNASVYTHTYIHIHFQQ